MSGINLVDVMQLLEKAEMEGYQVSFSNDELVVKANSKGKSNQAVLEELRTNKQHLVQHFRNHHQKKINGLPMNRRPIRKRAKDQRVPLSFAQEGLWFVHQLQGSTQYHMPWVFRLKGELDIPALEFSFAEIVRRHEILRTVYKEDEGVGYQE